MQAQTFSHVQQQTLDYWLYLPQNYDSSKRFPLVIFLHGAGERGALERVKIHGLPRLINEGQQYPFILAAPVCPLNDWWQHYTDALNGLLDSLLANYAVDAQRVYLTGLSMGGSGTWHWAMSNPERFAAVAPICGFGMGLLHPQGWEARLATVPIWAFHGAKDKIVKPIETRKMVRAARRAGGEVKFTLYDDADHNSWDAAYSDPELYRWLLSHSLDERG
jgi:predicted peptidase